MSPRARRATVVVAVLALIAFALWVLVPRPEPHDRIEVAGNVRSQTYTVAAPAISYPTPDYTVGIPTQRTARVMGAASASAGKAKTTSRSMLPVVAGQIATVTVELGDAVKAGDVVSELDPRLLELGIVAAQATARRARTDVDVMKDNLDTIRSNQSKLASAKGKLADGATQIAEGRSKLKAARKKLVATRKKAVAGRDALKAQIATLEEQIGRSGSANQSSTPGPTPQQLLAALKGKLAEIETGIAKIDAGLAKIDAGLAKLNAAENKLASARSQMRTGASALATARSQVAGARDVLETIADARTLGVDAARLQRDLALVTTPVDGTVTFVRPAGSVAMVGAPLVRIAPSGDQLVDTYLTDDQLARIRRGAKVEVRLDSRPDEVATGTVVSIGARSQFPPTSFPTDIVHMMRTTKVTSRLDDSATRLPAGTPVDLTIYTTSARP